MTGSTSLIITGEIEAVELISGAAVGAGLVFTVLDVEHANNEPSNVLTVRMKMN